MEFTIAQKDRLKELNVKQVVQDLVFGSAEERNHRFKELEKEQVRVCRSHIQQTLKEKHAVEALVLAGKLSDWLREAEGYTQVTTPTIITSKMLDQMTITDDHHLREQVFWLGANKCLRPMLAPNLYVVMRDLHKVTGEAVKIFEIGSCFRKESQGAEHMNEFTMLNFVEFATDVEGRQMERLKEMAHRAMKAAGIEDYRFEQEASTVYGETLDVVVDGIEVASGSYGPHRLDQNWGVFQTWVGLGIGIERLAMVKEKATTIKHVGKSISYFDGSPLNL